MGAIVQVPFLASAPLIVVRCVVRLGSNSAITHMALDSGTSFVMVKDTILRALGYDLTSAQLIPIHGFQPQPATAVLVTLESFGVVGAEEQNVDCLAFPLSPHLRVDGLVGLSYLKRFRRVTFDFGQEILVLERKNCD